MAQLNWSVLSSSFLSKLSSSKNSKQTVKTPRIDCDSEQSNREHHKRELWLGITFYRAHGGRQMILPVDLAQERCLVTIFLTSLTPRALQVHSTDSLSESLKNTQWRLCGRWRSDAQVSECKPPDLLAFPGDLWSSVLLALSYSDCDVTLVTAGYEH